MTKARSVFVAHKHLEAAFVQSMAVRLLDVKCRWRLADVIPLVDGWQALAFDAIREAQAFVLIVTPESLDSESCQFEWKIAVDLGKPIIFLELASELQLETPDRPVTVLHIAASRDFPYKAADALQRVLATFGP